MNIFEEHLKEFVDRYWAGDVVDATAALEEEIELFRSPAAAHLTEEEIAYGVGLAQLRLYHIHLYAQNLIGAVTMKTEGVNNLNKWYVAKTGEPFEEERLIRLVVNIDSQHNLPWIPKQEIFQEQEAETEQTTPDQHRQMQEEWRTKTLEYVAAMNVYLQRYLENPEDTTNVQPEDPGREHLAEEAIKAVRQANESGNLDGLRDRWPPAQQPFVETLSRRGRSIPVVSLLPDGSILARIGSPYETGKVVRISGKEVNEVPDIRFFGKSPNGRYFAVTRGNGVEILDGWDGPTVTICPWPTGMEDLPEGFDMKSLKHPPTPTRLIPFPDGKRVLMVSGEGVYVLSPEGARRLAPSKESLREFFAEILQEDPDEELFISMDMEHGAVSKDGKWIAVGGQDGRHLVYDADLNLVAEIGPHSEYPHYALFSADGDMVALNACHMYWGTTIGVRTKDLPGLNTQHYDEDDRIHILEETSRIYAGISRNDEFIVGDAGGFIRAISTTGELRWEHFIGSSIGDIDISSDGKTLIVSTAAGFLSIIQLDVGKQPPYQIGTGNHMELHRWIFWRGEDRPLIW